MKEFPIIKVVLALITGILIQKIFHFDLSSTIAVSILLILLQFITLIFPFLSKINLLRSLILLGTFAFLCASYINLSDGIKKEYPFEIKKFRHAVLEGKIKSMELPQKERITLTLEAETITLQDSGQFKLDINVLCRIYGDSNNDLIKKYKTLSVGNKISLEGTFSKPSGKRNPGEFDYAEYLKTQNISALFSVYELDNLKLINNRKENFQSFVTNLRFSIQNRIKKFSDERTAALITGLLLADRSGIDYEIREQFINAGVIHVLAVSGLHVGFIAFIFYILFNRFNIYARYLLTIGGLLSFMILTGMPPSVFRATIMAIVLLFTFLFNRSYNSFNALALAAFIILLANPSEFFNPGFQLSFSAVMSILVLYPIFNKYIRDRVKNKYLRYILLFAAVSLSAQIGTLPFTLYYFHKISVVSLLMNLFVIPLIAIIIAVAVVTMTASFFSSWLGLIYGSANNFFSYLLFNIVSFGGNSDYSFIYINEFSTLDVLIFYFFIILYFRMNKYFVKPFSKIVLGLLVFLNIYVYTLLDNKNLLPDGKLSVVGVDVGQGDAFILKFPNGKTALIDAGNANEYFDSGKRIKTLMNKLDIDKIDFGFISHIDADHYGGFITLLEEGLVDFIFKPAADTLSEKEVRFEKFLSDRDVSFLDYRKMIFKLPSSRIYCLNCWGENKKMDSNNRSGVLKICFGETSFLFTGDAEFEEEENLISIYKEFLDSDILKIGHHGSKKGTSEEFLEIVDPEYAIISAGYLNQFKHPSREVLKKLQNEDIKIKRTDIEGAIIINSSGENFRFIDWEKIEDRYTLN